MIHAVVPAGGQSTRMGRPKLLLPLGRHTVIEHIIIKLREAGLERILVVAAPQLPELAELARVAGASALVLPAPTPGMRETVEAGLDWIATHWQPGNADAWLLQPGDHPCVSIEVVQALLAARQAQPARSIFISTHQGRRGHPLLIGWEHVGGIRTSPSGLGLNAYLRTRPAETAEVPVECESILWDLDTPADYERLHKFVTTASAEMTPCAGSKGAYPAAEFGPPSSSLGDPR